AHAPCLRALTRSLSALVAGRTAEAAFGGGAENCEEGEAYEAQAFAELKGCLREAALHELPEPARSRS
ncbi:MAG: hypothetical protein JKY65_18165, partial [Planctomycetes bacterium]|nr:hypothetical protein [Planctomycetota bacterium]